MADTLRTSRNQRGAGLIVAMLVLLFITLLAAALMQNITTEDRITGENLKENTALNVAEAGVAEAIERLRQGDIPDNLNPRMVAQIYLAPGGSIPVCGPDTIALPTWQSGSMLNYSTANKGPGLLTVRYKTDAAQTKIYKYNPTGTPRIQTINGQPIFVVTSTGRVGTANRTVITEVIRAPLIISAVGALVGKVKAQSLHDGVFVCGFNHDADTPTWTAGVNGRDKKPGACNEDNSIQHWELPFGSIAGVWTQKFITNHKTSEWGSPAVVDPAPSFYAGAWEMLGLTKAEFFSMVGTPFTINTAASLNGVRFYKPSSGTLVVNGGNGDGLMYVDGDLQIKGTFTYRGLIYCTGRVDMNSHAWVLGSVVGEDETRLFGLKQSIVILYSRDAITENIGKYAGRFVTVSWREVTDPTMVVSTGP